LLSLTNTGASSSAGKVLSVNNSETGAAYGVYSTVSGSGNTGYAGYFTNTSTAGWAIYAGTAPSYFAGNVGIGSATPAAALDVSGQMYSRRYALTYSSTIALNWINCNIQSVQLTGNPTFTFAGGNDGLMIQQDSTGSRTVTWPGSVRWPGGSAPP
jgi:hypothetical protein